MKSVEKTLEYHELLMTNNNLKSVPYYKLPNGFSFVFWNGMDDLKDWLKIHIWVRENDKVFVYDYYKRGKELNLRK